VIRLFGTLAMLLMKWPLRLFHLTMDSTTATLNCGTTILKVDEMFAIGGDLLGFDGSDVGGGSDTPTTARKARKKKADNDKEKPEFFKKVGKSLGKLFSIKSKDKEASSTEP
jgi:hypothetical protein